MRMLKSRKGVLDQLSGFVIGLVVVGVVLAVGLLILSNVRTNATVVADNYSQLAVNQTILAIGGIPTWLPIIVIVFIGSILIGLIMMFREKT